MLLALAWRAGALGPCAGAGAGWRLYAVFEIAVPFPLIAAGEQHVASSLAAILIATVPLFVALLALRFDPAERATGWRLVGLFVGLAGVVALVGIDVAGRGDELLGAPAPSCSPPSATPPGRWSSSATWPTSTRAPRWARAWSIAAVAPRAAAPRSTRRRPRPRRRRSWPWSCSGCSAPRRRSSSSACSSPRSAPGARLVITYVAPVVAVALGVTVLGERPGPGAVAGLLLILAGSWLSTDGRLPPGLAAVVTRCARGARNGPWNGVRTR